MGGDWKVGVGSSVDNAEAPVSPLKSAPKLPDFRRGRGILSLSRPLASGSRVSEDCRWIYAPAKECECADIAGQGGLVRGPSQPINR